MNIINKMAGGIIGALTGALTAIAQIPYTYYVVALNRRAAGYSWPATLLATATIGSLFALAMGIATLVTFLSMSAWGVKVGWAKGIIGAVKLPYTFHTEFQKRLAGRHDRSLFLQFGHLLTSGIEFLDDTDSHGNVQHSRLARLQIIHQEYTQLSQENTRLTEEIRIMRIAQQEAKTQVQNALALQNNQIILERMDAPMSPEQKNIPLLTKDEIEEYQQAIQGLPGNEQKKSKENLADYLDRITCPLSLDTSDNPVTVVLPDVGPRTYDYVMLRRWVETRVEEVREPISSKHFMKDLDFYKGYSSRVINFIFDVREKIKNWKQKIEQRSLEIATNKTLVATVDKQREKASAPPSENKNNEAAREARLKFLGKQDTPHSTASDLINKRKKPTTPHTR